MVKCEKCGKNKSPNQMLYSGVNNKGEYSALLCIECIGKLEKTDCNKFKRK